MGWFAAAFIFLGFLVGQIVGMTSASVTTSIIGLLFTFAGGTAVGMLHKLTPEQRRLAAMAVTLLSIFCTVGIYTGILVKEHDLLSPKRPPAAERPQRSEGYLRNEHVTAYRKIDQQYRTGLITAEQAARQYAALLSKMMED